MMILVTHDEPIGQSRDLVESRDKVGISLRFHHGYFFLLLLSVLYASLVALGMELSQTLLCVQK